jgi:hypothetical protein
MGIGKIIGIILAIHFTLGLITAIWGNVVDYKENGRLDGDDVSASFFILIMGVVSFLTIVISEIAEFLEEKRPLEKLSELIAEKINKMIDKMSKKDVTE